MNYKKLPLTFEQQADQLLKRGLIADRNELVYRLQSVNYYRLSGYLYPFRNEDNIFHKGTSLEKIWRQYTFDRHLRLLIMDGIERIEISIRTSLSYYFSHAHGPFGYVDRVNLSKIDNSRFSQLLERLLLEKKRSKEAFVEHFKENYGNCHQYLPLWMAVEIANFGTIYTLYKGSDPSIKKIVASQYGIADSVLLSWLNNLNTVRNICAHHARLWNREIVGYKPLIPKVNKYPEWHKPVEVANNRIFAVLTIIKYMLNIIALQSNWPSRLNSLLKKYPEIPLKSMGFPDNWQDSFIWEENK